MIYHAAIFDIDGTLLDSVDLHAEAWRQIFERHGRVVAVDQIRAQIGKGGDQLLPLFFSEADLKRFGDEMSKERTELFQREMLPVARPFPGVRALFERLHADGIRLALASSATRQEVDIYSDVLGIKDLLAADASTEDASKSKPHPDIFEATLQRLGKPDPAEVLAIGDTPYDVEAAAKAGIRTIGVLCGGFPEDDLRRSGAMALYRDPADLLARYAESPFAAGTH